MQNSIYFYKTRMVNNYEIFRSWELCTVIADDVTCSMLLWKKKNGMHGVAHFVCEYRQNRFWRGSPTSSRKKRRNSLALHSYLFTLFTSKLYSLYSFESLFFHKIRITPGKMSLDRVTGKPGNFSRLGKTSYRFIESFKILKKCNLKFNNCLLKR